MRTHLVQITDGTNRRIALVQEPELLLLSGPTSIYELAQQCVASGLSMAEQARSLVSIDSVSYDEVYEGRSAWRLLPPIDVPVESCRYLPTTSLEFASPLGCVVDLLFNNNLEDSHALAARIMVFPFT